jgi:hypothetical protein
VAPSYPNHLILRALALAPTQAAVAEILGMTTSRLSRVKKHGRLGMASCMRLADVLGEDPAAVLRTYGYETEAAILERAYPKRGRRPQGNASMLADVAKLTPARLRLVRELIAALSDEKKRR